MNKIINLVKKQTVLFIAAILTTVTCIIVPPDSEYLNYFNWRTLATLFCTLAVVSAFSHIYLFEIISRAIVINLKTLRKVTYGIVFITFFGSMILANDMALITFLPLGYYVLKSTGKENHMAFLFIMQNIAANLGGMLTPFGNPQNLYLYSYYNIDTLSFMHIMFPPFLAATGLIIIICAFVRPEPLTLYGRQPHLLNWSRTIMYSMLFICSILIVFRIFPCLPGTIIITLLLLILDSRSIKEVNYPLLMTFCVFFVFSGNMARIPAVHSLFSKILPINSLLFGILSCQFISNVPSAVLLSHFTNDYAGLLPAVNIGGCGTLIASLASLITFSEYKKHQADKTGSYLLKFTIFNLAFIILLYIVTV